MRLQWNPLLDTPPQPKRDAEGVTDTVQGPVLVIGFQRQTTETLDLGLSVGVANGLIDPGTADVNIRKRLTGELAPFFLRHGEDFVSNLGIETLKTRKLLSLGLIKP